MKLVMSFLFLITLASCAHFGGAERGVSSDQQDQEQQKEKEFHRRQGHPFY